MNILIFDTETTGFVNNKIPTNHPNQGRCAQIGAILQDHEGRVLQELNGLIKPDGWIMGEGAARVHGFTQDLCEKQGLPGRLIWPMFQGMTEKADLVVAHNYAFDDKILTIESILGHLTWRPKNNFCTMLATTDMCAIPGKFGNYKWPKLIEVYSYLFNETFEGAHDAMADVRACSRVFFELLRRGNVDLLKFTGRSSNIIKV